MTTETQKFLKGIKNTTKAILSFLMLNLMTFAIANVRRNKDGSITFTSISDFHNIEEVTLSIEEQKIWDLFADFNNPKNAANCILDAIAKKKGITAETYKNQSKITAPEQYNCKGIKTFTQFWKMLNKTEQKHAIALANSWIRDNHLEQTSFDFFFINGANKTTLKAGDYLLTYDAAYGQRLATRVLQASPEGFVTCLDNGGYFTLAANSKPQKVSREAIDSEIAGILDKTFDKISEETEEHKTYRLEQAIKRADRQAILDEKAEKKAEKEAERLAKIKTSQDTKDEILKMKLTTPEAIKQAVATLNGTKMQKTHIAEVKTILKEAKAKLKATTETEADNKETPKAQKIEPKAKQPEKAKTGTKAPATAKA